MAKTPQPCGCGCEGMTKGGRFLPGHDARFHAAQKTGRLGAAIKHATGAHGTASPAPPGSSGYPRAGKPEKPGDAAPVTREGPAVEQGGKTGKGTKVEPGMWVRAIFNQREPAEGIVFGVDPFGNVAFMDDHGKQYIGYPNMTWVLDTNTKRQPTPAVRQRLTQIGRYVPAMMQGKE